MKMDKRDRLSSAVFLVIAALLLELTTAVQYYSTRHNITKQVTEMAQHDLSKTRHITLIKEEVEMTIMKAMPTFERLTKRGDEDSVRIVIRDILEHQKAIVGIEYCPIEQGRDPRGVYLYKDDELGHVTEHPIDFDFTKRSWYHQGINSDGFWGEPYMSNYKVILMCTFARSIRDSNGRTIAVLGADVPMRMLSALTAKLHDIQQRSLLPLILLHVLGLILLGFIIQRSVRNARRLEAIGAEKERIANELNVARNIQLAMLPKTFPPFPDRKDVDIFAQLTPAREVGGDYYDFFIRDEKLFFCIGDVSGKGVPAALVMAVARSVFRMLTERESAPDRIITQMNDSMARENDYCMFITLFIGVLDLPTGRLRYCNAGHKAPLLDSKPIPILPNLPVGVMMGHKFVAQETMIDSGSTLFLYTDGLTEAENAEHALFGEQRMYDVYAESIAQHDNPTALIGRMEQAVRSFANGTDQSDDLTMIALRYTRQQFSARIQQSLTLPCDVSQTPRLSEWVEGICEQLEFSPSATMQTNLAIEEAVVNVMNYAYPKGVAGEVRIDAEANDKRLKVTITDSGQPFDPTTRGQVDTSLDADERAIGGLGIHLIRRYMDSINYERFDGHNILTLRKKIDGGTSDSDKTNI